MAPRKTSTKKASESPNEAASTPEQIKETATKRVKKTKKTVSCHPKPALNIRPTPDMTQKPVGEVPDGAEVECEEPVEGWCKVKDGYVCAEFLV